MNNEKLILLIEEKIAELVAANKPAEVLEWIKVRDELMQPPIKIKWDYPTTIPYIPPNDTGTPPWWVPNDNPWKITWHSNLTPPKGGVDLNCCG